MPKKLFLETFGCQMNVLDSELVLGQLRGQGYQSTNDRDDADVIVYNTCSVREHAEQKVWSRLGELKDRKRDNPELVIGVIGCMAERDGADLFRKFPQIDLLCGPGELDKLAGMVHNAVVTGASVTGGSGRRERQSALMGAATRRSSTLAAAEDSLEMLDLSRSISPVDVDAPSQAYVRITRGCNKFCTYCVVPYTRGPEVHRPPGNIVDEVRKLAESGVREVTLLGADDQSLRVRPRRRSDDFVRGSALSDSRGRPFAGAAAICHQLSTRFLRRRVDGDARLLPHLPLSARPRPSRAATVFSKQ